MRKNIILLIFFLFLGLPLVANARVGEICEDNDDCSFEAGELCDEEQRCYLPPPGTGPAGTPTGPPLPAAPEAPPAAIAMPRLQIPLVTLQPFTRPFRETEGEKEFLIIDFLAQYLAAVYKFLVAIVGVVAGVMIVYAGFKWLTAAGSPDKISDAKRKIADASVGLILVLGSYIILSIINPDLVVFKPLTIEYVKRIPLGEDGGHGESELGSDAVTNARNIGIHCPGSGGSAEIPRIARSFSGRMVYRWNGKGGPPPYSEQKAEYRSFNNFCPSGKLCLDCSGYASLVMRCAGLQFAPPRGGEGFFLASGGEEINPATTDLARNTVNGRPLQPGDHVGFKNGDTVRRRGREVMANPGHVVIYIGNGEVAESGGGIKGREDGSFRISPITNWAGQLTRIRRIDSAQVITP